MNAPRLADLTRAQQRLVTALLAAQEAAAARKKAAPAIDPEAAQPEVHCHARPAA
jgi:hypothetical protein